MAIFMDARSFAKGSVTAQGYVDWVRIESMQFGAEKKLRTETNRGNEQNIKAGQPKYTHFTISKRLDDASGHLMELTLQGKKQSGHEVALAICTLGKGAKGAPREYARYVLTNTKLVSYGINFSGSELVEEATLAYESGEATFIPHSNKNTALARRPILFEVKNELLNAILGRAGK
jgi:type VI secretion system secreted protein Hcp